MHTCTFKTSKIVYKNNEEKYRDGLVKKYGDKIGMGRVQEWPCPTSTSHIHIHIPQGRFSIPHKTKLKAAYIACMVPTDEGLATAAGTISHVFSRFWHSSKLIMRQHSLSTQFWLLVSEWYLDSAKMVLLKSGPLSVADFLFLSHPYM